MTCGLAENYHARFMQGSKRKHRAPVSADMSKYDRQIRLWSETGQGSLGEAHFLILGVSATTTELAKNVVLAGVGAVTIVDEHRVSAADCAASFFMQSTDEGRNRAQAVVELIAQLNSETVVTGVSENPDAFLKNAKLSSYTLVVTTRITRDRLNKLEKYFPETPVLQLESFGFFGRLRCMFRLHTVLESHPESKVELHLHSVWPALQEFSDSINLETISDYEHEHVPYIVLLIKGLDLWRASHGDSKIQSAAEKSQFKQLLREFARSYEQENVQEAVRNAWRVSAPAVPEGVREILEFEAPPAPFFVLAAALKVFVEKHNELPLSGYLPDMKSDTNWYTRAINIYREKSTADLKEFTQYYHELCTRLDLRPLCSSAIETFCKNSRYIRVQVGVSSEQDAAAIVAADSDVKELFSCIEAANDYLAMLEHQSWSSEPSSLDHLVRAIGSDSATVRKLWSSGGEELHSIASFMGGLGAQEAIKLAMDQYTPIMHTLVYDGIRQATYVHHNGRTLN